MPKNYKIALVVLAVAVVVGLISVRSLRRRVTRLAQEQKIDEQARKAVLAPPISTPTDTPTTATIFWAAGADKIAPVQVQLPLSADPEQRSRQVLRALISNPPTAGQRTVPADTDLLAFYILQDGTAVADFSETLGSEMPSGILSEQAAVDSIAQTLGANVPNLHRLKILIHGQEADTLAGHVDLSGFFDLNPTAASAAVVSPTTPGGHAPSATP